MTDRFFESLCDQFGNRCVPNRTLRVLRLFDGSGTLAFVVFGCNKVAIRTATGIKALPYDEELIIAELNRLTHANTSNLATRQPAA